MFGQTKIGAIPETPTITATDRFLTVPVGQDSNAKLLRWDTLYHSLAAISNSYNGTFTGDGSGLTNLNVPIRLNENDTAVITNGVEINGRLSILNGQYTFDEGEFNVHGDAAVWNYETGAILFSYENLEVGGVDNVSPFYFAGNGNIKFGNAISTGTITGDGSGLTNLGDNALVIWGDSLTVGLCQSALPTNLPAWTVYQRGVGGETSDRVMTRCTNNVKLRTANTIIWAGANDANTFTQTVASVATMVAHLQTTNYLVCSFLLNNANTNGTAAWTNAVAANSNLAAAYPGHFLDVFAMVTNGNPGLVTSSNLLADTIHLNAAGYNLVATNIAAWIATNWIPHGQPARPFAVSEKGASIYAGAGVGSGSAIEPSLYGGANVLLLGGDTLQDSYSFLRLVSTPTGQWIQSYAARRTNSPLNGILYIGTGGNREITINTNMFVGIGNTSPSNKLDVVGNAKITDTVTASAFVANGVGVADTNWVLQAIANAERNGVYYYNSTNLAGDNGYAADAYRYATENPHHFARTYSGLTSASNVTYLGTVITPVMVTNPHGPATVTIYASATGVGSPAISIKPELYFSLDKTNTLFEAQDVGPLSVSTSGTTNAYTWNLPFPDQPTSWVIRRIKTSDINGTVALTIHGGTNFPSILSLSGAGATSGGTVGALTNNETRDLVFLGATNFLGTNVGIGTASAGVLTATSVAGDGNGLTNLAGANVTGAVPLATSAVNSTNFYGTLTAAQITNALATATIVIAPATNTVTAWLPITIGGTNYFIPLCK